MCVDYLTFVFFSVNQKSDIGSEQFCANILLACVLRFRKTDFVNLRRIGSDRKKTKKNEIILRT